MFSVTARDLLFSIGTLFNAEINKCKTKEEAWTAIKNFFKEERIIYPLHSYLTVVQIYQAIERIFDTIYKHRNYHLGLFLYELINDPPEKMPKLKVGEQIQLTVLEHPETKEQILFIIKRVRKRKNMEHRYLLEVKVKAPDKASV